MGYMLRGSKNGLADLGGPPSHFLWKSQGYMLRAQENGLADVGRSAKPFFHSKGRLRYCLGFLRPRLVWCN